MKFVNGPVYGSAELFPIVTGIETFYQLRYADVDIDIKNQALYLYCFIQYLNNPSVTDDSVEYMDYDYIKDKIINDQINESEPGTRQKRIKAFQLLKKMDLIGKEDEDNYAAMATYRLTREG